MRHVARLGCRAVPAGRAGRMPDCADLLKRAMNLLHSSLGERDVRLKLLAITYALTPTSPESVRSGSVLHCREPPPRGTVVCGARRVDRAGHVH